MITKYKLAVCPHDSEKGIYKWKIFSDLLTSKLGIEFAFKPFKDLKEEEDKITLEEYHLVYSNPTIAPLLYQKGYRPLAKFKGQKDVMLLISAGNPERGAAVRVAVPVLKHSLLGLLHIYDKFENIEIDYTDSFFEIFHKVEAGISDIGIIYKETFDDIEKQGISRRITIIEEVPLSSSHIFMVHPELFEKIKDKFFELNGDIINIFNNEGLESAGEAEIESLSSLSIRLDSLLKVIQDKEISTAVLGSPSIAVFIFRKKIVYANSYASQLTGYSSDELKSMGMEELIAEKHVRKKHGEIYERIFNGEYFEVINDELKFHKKNGVSFWALTFLKTIFFDGRHSGLAILTDVTKRKRIENLYTIIREVNQLMIMSSMEEELFERVCKTLTDKLGLKFVWIGRQDKDDRIIKTVYKCGYENGYLSEIKISLDPSVEEGTSPAAAALREGKILINQDSNPDSNQNIDITPWREEQLKRGYLSSCSIPLQKWGEIRFILCLYSSEPYFFEEENRDILQELQKDISFMLTRLSEIRRNALISEALKNSDEWLVVTNEKANIIFANDSASEISGYSKDELLGSNPRVLKSGYQDKSFYENLWNTLLADKIFSSIFANRKKNGQIFYVQMKIIPVHFPNSPTRFVSIGRDITKEIGLTSEIEEIRFHDILTGLFNLNAFSFKISEILEDTNETYLLVLIDIHNLTYINQVYGLSVGDELLKKAASLLKETFKDSDIVAKVGGDEFGIFLRNIKKKDDAFVIIDKLLSIFKRSVDIEGKNIYIAINAGVALFPDDGLNFKTLYERASAALSNAKKEGAGEIEFFNPLMEDKAVSFVRTETLVEKAIKENLFIFYYQPYFNTYDLSVSGFESLVRLKDKDGKIYPPSVFIDYLENSIYLKPFEEFALKTVTGKILEWNVNISLNISTKSFKREDFMQKILEACYSVGSRLTIEITERVLVEDVEKTKFLLNGLKYCKKSKGEEGICENPLRIAMDDFGTGYSSLFVLKDLPINIIKIDISFIRDITKGPKELALVKAIIQLAGELGLQTVAEGVETQEQLELLKELKCDFVQGFLLAKPMPEEDVLKFLAG